MFVDLSRRLMLVVLLRVHDASLEVPKSQKRCDQPNAGIPVLHAAFACVRSHSWPGQEFTPAVPALDRCPARQHTAPWYMKSSYLGVGADEQGGSGTRSP